MVFGYNEDVEYCGKKYHVQSELNRDAVLCIQLFQEGTLLHMEKIPSQDVQWNDDMPELQKLLQDLLWRCHQAFIADLKSGRYDECLSPKKRKTKGRR